MPDNNPDEIQAGYKKLQQADEMLKTARAGLDTLVGMGDNIVLQDLVSEAGKIVAAGVSPGAMASLLADAPQDNPQLLAEWVQQQDQQLAQREAQLELAMRVQRQRMGVAGMQLIAKARSAGNPLMSTDMAPTPAPGGGGPAPASASLLEGLNG